MRITVQKLITLVLIINLFILTSACGTRDWTYNELPGNYELWRINSKNISFCARDNDGTTAEIIVGPYISSFTYTSDYIFLQQISVSSDDKPTKETAPNYYLLVVENDKLYGPMDRAEFDSTCIDLGIKEFPGWMNTSDISKQI